MQQVQLIMRVTAYMEYQFHTFIIPLSVLRDLVLLGGQRKSYPRLSQVWHVCVPVEHVNKRGWAGMW